MNKHSRRMRSALGAGLLLALCCGMFAGCASTSPAGKPQPLGESKAVEATLQVATKDLHKLPEGSSPAESAPAETGQAQAVPPEGAVPEEYRIGPGDVLDFRSFDDETLSGPAVVRYDGQISLPLIPDVNVANLTRAEATARVREAYLAHFIDPRVSLSVNQPASKIYYVMGNVARPDQYPYVRPITLLDAINIAGGPRLDLRGGDTYVGAQGQLTVAIIIRHQPGGEREIIKRDLSNLAKPGAHASDTPVFPNDIVYVPEGVNLVYVLGEVGRPGVFQLSEDMTLLQALTLAGGPTERSGRLKEIVLMREVDAANTEVRLVNFREMMKTGTQVPIQAGDIIYVPQKRVTRLSEFVAQFTGSVSPVLGLYMQAYDAWYTDKRYHEMFKDNAQFGGGLGTITQIMRDLGGLSLLVP